MIASLASPLWAEDAKKAPGASKGADAPKTSSPGAKEACPARCPAQGSALDTIARALAAGLGRVPDGATVVTVALESDEEARRGPALAAAIAEQLAGRLGAGVGFEATPVDADAALAAAEAPGIVIVRPRIERGKLRVTADAYPVATSVWARARAAKRPGPVAHAHALASIDAEVRGYLAPLGIGEVKVARFEGADPEIKAIACGDLDGDGETDVVTMNRQRVLRVRLREGKVERLVEATWESLAPIAPVPLREPLGFATIVGGTLDVALTDRRGSVRLDAQLDKIAAMEGKAVPLGSGTACTWISNLRLGEKVVPCQKDDPPPAIERLRHRADAIDSTVVVDERGKARVLVALRKDGTLVLHDGERDSFVARVGAQIAVGDLDQDGSPDLVSTIDTLAPKQDAVEIRSLQRGTVKVRARVPVPTGVEAVAICPPDRPAAPAPILVATAGQLWVLR